jgi:hypothetical protein
MPTLEKFRLLGAHFVGALAGVYIAAVLARFLASFWPSARLPTLIIGSLFFILSELSVAIRELHKGRLSTGIIVLDFMPLLLLGTGFSLFLGKLFARWFGSDMGGVIVFWGVYSCILGVIGAIKYAVQDRNLQEDLQKSPDAVRLAHSDLADEQRTYVDDYGEPVPRSRWTLLANIAKALLVIVVILLFFIFVSFFH